LLVVLPFGLAYDYAKLLRVDDIANH